MAEYRNYIIQAARPTSGRNPHKTSAIQVLEKGEHANVLLKRFRFTVDSDESLQRAIQHAKNYIDHVADRELLEAAQRQAKQAGGEAARR